MCGQRALGIEPYTDLIPGLEFAHDNAELGAALNGFSLSEQGHLAAAIEKTGQAIDSTYISTTRLVRYRDYFSAIHALTHAWTRRSRTFNRPGLNLCTSMHSSRR